MDVIAAFGDEMKQEFMLESSSTFVNHGSYGAAPRRALDYRLRYVYMPYVSLGHSSQLATENKDRVRNLVICKDARCRPTETKVHLFRQTPKAAEMERTSHASGQIQDLSGEGH